MSSHSKARYTIPLKCRYKWHFVTVLQTSNFKRLNSVSPPLLNKSTITHSFTHSFTHPSIHPSLALQPCVGPGIHFLFLNQSSTFGRTPWTSDQPIAKPGPPTGQHNIQKPGTNIRVLTGFETAIRCTSVQHPSLIQRGHWIDTK
jgi:hypothetical protein